MSKHVKLNGLWYRLAEDAEGQHYNMSLQPLRPPNSQIVQGDPGTFQIRPDLLLWRQESWSGGEGQIKFDPQSPARAFSIQHGDPFSRPGTMQPSPQMAIAQDELAADLGDGYLAIAIGALYWVDSTTVRTWGGSNFTATSSITTTTNACSNPVGDAKYLFVHENSSVKIHRFDGTTWILLNDQCAFGSNRVLLAELGDYLYVWCPTTGELFEISKATANTSSPETPLAYTPTNANLSADRALMVAGDNRIYIAVTDDQRTMIHEIIPTSAAGDGYGSEIAVLPGVYPEALFYAGGTIFMIGYDEAPDDTVGPDRQIFYIDPEGSYGTLGSIRGLYDIGGTAGPSSTAPFPAYGGQLGTMAFVLASNTEGEAGSSTHLDLWEIDLITGGYACLAGDSDLLASATDPKALVFWQGLYFAADGNKTVVWDPDDRTGEKTRIVSTTNDFDLAGDKILESIEVVIDPLPANGTVTVGYILDDGTEVQSALSLSTGDTGGKFTVSNDTTTKTFRSMQYTVELDGATTIPVLRSVDVYARVNRRLRIWDLLLDATDENAPQGYSGNQMIDNILSIPENTVIDFVDHYLSYAPGDEEAAADVVLDSAQFALSQQGEGVIAVRLMEVV